MKKIFVILLIIFSVFVIYLATMDRKVYYLALGDSSKYSYDFSGNKVYGYSYYVSNYLDRKGVLERYVHEYSGSNIRINDLIDDIEDNKKYGNYTLKNSLIKADLVTLNVDASDVYSRILIGEYDLVYDYIDGLCKDFEELLKVIRQYCKEDIVFVGYFNLFDKTDSDISDLIDYFNRRYKEICDDYDVVFADLSNISLNGNYDGGVHFSFSDYRKIGNEVIKKASKSIFEG